VGRLAEEMRLRGDEPVIIGGDLNVPKFNPSLTSEYFSMIKTLGVGDPSGLGTPLLHTGGLPVQAYCTYCYGINQLASEPADGQTILDYLLHSLDHKLPRALFRRPRVHCSNTVEGVLLGTILLRFFRKFRSTDQVPARCTGREPMLSL
jgi:hypothetical protein